MTLNEIFTSQLEVQAELLDWFLPRWQRRLKASQANSWHLIMLLHLLFWPEHLCLTTAVPYRQHVSSLLLPAYTFPVKFNAIAKSALLQLNSCLSVCLPTCLKHEVVQACRHTYVYHIVLRVMSTRVRVIVTRSNYKEKYYGYIQEAVTRNSYYS